MDLAINYMTMNAMKYKKLTVFGGNQFRPFVHVKHIGEIIVENLNYKKGGVYNVASENASIIDVAKQIKKETRCKVIVTDQKFQDDRNYFANVKKGLKDNIFTNKAKYSIEYGIKEIKELVLSKRIKDLELKYYSNERYLLESMPDYENKFIL
jgi:nucleoside-diphosphate-sugar epimerase